MIRIIIFIDFFMIIITSDDTADWLMLVLPDYCKYYKDYIIRLTYIFFIPTYLNSSFVKVTLKFLLLPCNLCLSILDLCLRTMLMFVNVRSIGMARSQQSWLASLLMPTQSAGSTPR